MARNGPPPIVAGQVRYVNAPDETLRHIADRIENSRIYTDRDNETNCKLLAAAYREILLQRRIIKRIDKKLTLATQRDMLEEGGYLDGR